MFRQPRRKKQILSPEECEKALCGCTSGVLALSGDDGYPYAVPMSYVYDGGKIYFHCAKEGHKIDSVKRCEKASFCVTVQNEISQEMYTTFYKSVIVFGKIRIVEAEPEKISACMKLAGKYSPDLSDERHREEIERFRSSLCVLELEAEHITGKQSKFLVKEQ